MEQALEDFERTLTSTQKDYAKTHLKMKELIRNTEGLLTIIFADKQTPLAENETTVLDMINLNNQQKELLDELKKASKETENPKEYLRENGFGEMFKEYLDGTTYVVHGIYTSSHQSANERKGTELEAIFISMGNVAKELIEEINIITKKMKGAGEEVMEEARKASETLH